jgi:hypothetical protein
MTPARQREPLPSPRGGALAALATAAGIFALVYARALTFVYIDGDDATSIAYHALGRLRDVQPPYSAYQSMMDALLRLLPAREALLRTAGMLITATAAPLLVLLMVLLAYEWCGGRIRISKPAAVLVTALASPELFYLGLVYTPALVAMSAAVAAHLMARRACRTHPGWAFLRSPWFWASAALFGAGVACRWDMLAYGGIVAGDLWLQARPARWTTATVWGTAGLAAWFAAIWANGYGPRVVIQVLHSSGPVESYPPFSLAAAYIQPLATPAFVLLAAVGFLLLAKGRHPLCLLVLLGLALTARYIPLGNPKWFLETLPALSTCMLAGFSAVWNWRGGAVVARIAAAACLAAPWLIGIQTLAGDSAYGPGFEVRPFDRPARTARLLRPVFGGGALIPGPEGPRALGGHAWVLLGGGWRHVVRQVSGELERAARMAAASGLPLLQDYGQGFVPATLAGMGYTTRDFWKQEARTFVSADGRTKVRVLRFNDREVLFTPAGRERVEALAGGARMVAFAYTSTLRRLYKAGPGALEKLGATAAVVDLERVRAPADKMADSVGVGVRVGARVRFP